MIVGIGDLLDLDRAIIGERDALDHILTAHGATAHGPAEHIELVAAKRRLDVRVQVLLSEVAAPKARAKYLDRTGLKVEGTDVVGPEVFNRLGTVVVIHERAAADQEQAIADVHDRRLARHIVCSHLVGEVGPLTGRRIEREELFGGEAAGAVALARTHHEQLAVPERGTHVADARGQALSLAPRARLDVVAPHVLVDGLHVIDVLGRHSIGVVLLGDEHVDGAVERDHLVVDRGCVERIRQLDLLLKGRHLGVRDVLGKAVGLGVRTAFARSCGDLALNAPAQKTRWTHDLNFGVGPALDLGALAAKGDLALFGAKVRARDGHERIVAVLLGLNKRGRIDNRLARRHGGDLARVDHTARGAFLLELTVEGVDRRLDRLGQSGGACGIVIFVTSHLAGRHRCKARHTRCRHRRAVQVGIGHNLVASTHAVDKQGRVLDLFDIIRNQAHVEHDIARTVGIGVDRELCPLAHFLLKHRRNVHIDRNPLVRVQAARRYGVVHIDRSGLARGILSFDRHPKRERDLVLGCAGKRRADVRELVQTFAINGNFERDIVVGLSAIQAFFKVVRGELEDARGIVAGGACFGRTDLGCIACNRCSRIGRDLLGVLVIERVVHGIILAPGHLGNKDLLVAGYGREDMGARGKHIGRRFAVVGECRTRSVHGGRINDHRIVAVREVAAADGGLVDVIAIVTSRNDRYRTLAAHGLHGKADRIRAVRSAPRIVDGADVHAGVECALDVGVSLEDGALGNGAVLGAHAHADELGAVRRARNAKAVPLRGGHAGHVGAVQVHVGRIGLVVARGAVAVLAAADLAHVGAHIVHDALEIGVVGVDAGIDDGDDLGGVDHLRVVPVLELGRERALVNVAGVAGGAVVGPLERRAVADVLAGHRLVCVGRHALGGRLGVVARAIGLAGARSSALASVTAVIIAGRVAVDARGGACRSSGLVLGSRGTGCLFIGSVGRIRRRR